MQGCKDSAQEGEWCGYEFKHLNAIAPPPDWVMYIVWCQASILRNTPAIHNGDCKGLQVAI